jgi:hypothetical protein
VPKWRTISLYHHTWTWVRRLKLTITIPSISPFHHFILYTQLCLIYQLNPPQPPPTNAAKAVLYVLLPGLISGSSGQELSLRYPGALGSPTSKPHLSTDVCMCLLILQNISRRAGHYDVELHADQKLLHGGPFIFSDCELGADKKPFGTSPNVRTLRQPTKSPNPKKKTVK